MIKHYIDENGAYKIIKDDKVQFKIKINPETEEVVVFTKKGTFVESLDSLSSFKEAKTMNSAEKEQIKKEARKEYIQKELEEAQMLISLLFGE